MFQYPWTSAEVMPPITGEDEETATGDREEDLLPEEMYPPQDMEAHPDALILEKKDIMHATVLRRNSYPTMRGTTDKPTSSIYRIKRNRTIATTTKCTMSKKQI